MAYLERVEAEIVKMKRSRPLSGERKRKSATPPAVVRPGPAQALTARWKEVNKVVAALEAQMTAENLESFVASEAWKNLVKRNAANIITAFFRDAGVIKAGQAAPFLSFVKQRIK